ncbi:MAG: hypothetical protein LUC92_00400 [Clostridiales bacterium]|nr:hypothetical protein [Clostridiales bacterium]
MNTYHNYISEKERDKLCGIRDGHPYSWVDTELFSAQPPEHQALIVDWIENELVPAKTKSNPISSNRLKAVLEKQLPDVDISNNALKDALYQCGYEPVNVQQFNWLFCIDRRKSPALVAARKGHY